MRIQVRLHGGLGRQSSSQPVEVDVDEGATVSDVIDALGLRSGDVWLITLDGLLIERDHDLHPGDALSLIPPVGGG